MIDHNSNCKCGAKLKLDCILIIKNSNETELIYSHDMRYRKPINGLCSNPEPVSPSKEKEGKHEHIFSN